MCLFFSYLLGLNNFLFSLEITCVGDVTYNSRRGILGAIPLYKKIGYHLFRIDANASKEDIVKLYRKSKWPEWNYDGDWKDGVISGLDFNPTGEYAATIDQMATVVISDVDTNNCIYNSEDDDDDDIFFTNDSLYGNFDKTLSFSSTKNKLLNFCRYQISLTFSFLIH